MTNPTSIIIFMAFILLMLALDLGIFHRKDEPVTFKNAAIWTAIWISIALLFGGLLWVHGEWIHGISNISDLERVNDYYRHNLNINGMPFGEAIVLYRQKLSMEYISGYLIEKVLSVDNIFVMILLFTSFNIAPKYYHRILFYGILGAIVFRFIFIFVASALIHQFEWVLVIFGLILIYSASKMFIDRNKTETVDIDKNKMIHFLKKRGLVTTEVKNHNFFIKENGKWLLTPLFLVLMMVEFADVVFAVDSIPAVFGVTRDPYIVFFSNIFAILGLRSLFFMVMSIMNKFKWLKYVLMLLLFLIGVKMIYAYFF